MKKLVNRTSRWFAIAALLSPATFCCAESPTPALEVTSAEENVTETPVAEQQTAPVVVDLKNAPLFKHASYPAAWTAAQESNRPILVYVSMPQCPHCTKMLEQTYESNGVNEIVKGSFETLQVSRHTHAALVSKLHVRWYPSTVLVSSNNKVLDMIEGYVDANTFKQRLQLGIASANSDTQTR
jgi:hypothetical protein